MKVYLETIPHSSQRYDTVGDWFQDVDMLMIPVSEMGNENYHFLVGLHELIEAHLCLQRRIKESEVTKFDKQFKDKGEPGDHPRAPYYKEHQFATKIEQLVAKELKVDWKAYDKAVNKLVWRPSNRKRL